MYPLFTIGYEKTKPVAVLDELKRAKVDLLVDARAVAASRRPGVSKRQLAAALDEAGVAYIHCKNWEPRPKGAPRHVAAISTHSGASMTTTSSRATRRTRSMYWSH
jgi:hypothetical protein